MPAAAVTAGIHLQRLAGFGPHRHGFMAKTAQGRVLHRSLISRSGVHLHHPAVLVAGQSVDVAKPPQFSVLADERPLRRRRCAAIGIDRFRHLGLEILLSAEHSPPGRGAATAVGKRAHDPVAQAVVIALPVAGPEHRRSRTRAEQLLVRLIQSADTRDASILRGLGPFPPALTFTLQGHHPDSEVGHRFIRDGADLLQAAITGLQRRAVDDAIAALEGRHKGGKGQRSTHHLGKALHPGHGTDVFEIDRHRRPIRCVLHKTEVIVVEPEAAVAEAITPGRQQLRLKPLRNRQPVLHRQLPIGGLLFAGLEPITVHRQGHPHRLKGESFDSTAAVATWRDAARQSLGRQHTDSTEAEQGEHGTSAHRSDLNRCRQWCGVDSAPQPSLTEAD